MQHAVELWRGDDDPLHSAHRLVQRPTAGFEAPSGMVLEEREPLVDEDGCELGRVILDVRAFTIDRMLLPSSDTLASGPFHFSSTSEPSSAGRSLILQYRMTDVKRSAGLIGTGL